MSAAPWTKDSFWAGTRRPLRDATALEPAAYVSEEFFADERDCVFERAWVAVGNAADVAEPGRMLVREVGERSVIITRGERPCPFRILRIKRIAALALRRLCTSTSRTKPF